MLEALDHAVVAVPDLDAATERTAALLGRPPAWRGVHPGAGSANALFRLSNTCLELLAPDGEGPVGAALRERLERTGPGLAALAFATSDAERCALFLRARGLDAGAPQRGEGRDAAGARRSWRSVALPQAATRGLFLLCIERETPPAPDPGPGADPAACAQALDHAVVLCGDLDAGADLYGRALGLRLALDRRFAERGIRILFFRVGGVTLEVVGSLAPDAAAPGSDRFGGLAWRVASADAAHARLRSAGFSPSPPRAGAKPGTRVFTVKGDTCGVPTLVIGPEPSATDAAAR